MKTNAFTLFIFLFTFIKLYGFQIKSGIISSQDIWSDTIHVVGDITVIQGGDIIINPGTYIEFEGFYFIKVTQTGKINANGSVTDSIRFISFDLMAGWKGVIFDTMFISADSSVFEYCSFQNGKGALSIKNFNKVRVSHCSFSNNRPETSASGGGIFCSFSTIMIENCLFRNNYAADGGALYFYASNAIINKTRITANTIYWSGAGIYCDTSYLFLNNCLIDSNYHTNSGGGAGIYSKKSTVTLTGCRVMNNSRNAIYSYNYGGKLNLYNTIVANNEGADGGGLICLGIELTIINSTIVNNKAGAGSGAKAGGVYCSNSRPVRIYNSILWNNSGIYPDFYFLNYYPHIFNCDIRDGNLFNLPDSQYVNNISVDPRFVKPSSTIGVSSDALQADWSVISCSPCINNGDSSLSCTVPLVFDIIQNPRIYNDTVDIGAYEFQGNHLPGGGARIIYVTENGTGEGSSWANAMGNIQTAIETPLGCNEHLEVWVAAGTYYPLFTGQVFVRETSFTLKDNVRIYGGFIGNETDLNGRDWMVNKTILSGDVGITDDNTDNAYHVVTAVNVGNSAILDGFEISGGNANTSFNFDNGGGIYCSYANPILENLFIQNNYGNNHGGGVYLVHSRPKIINSVIFNNHSYHYGAGIYMSYSNAFLINSQVVSNNNSIGFYGGGINLENSNPYIINSIIANNYASQGGGIYCSNSRPYIINSLFANNLASEGGGIYSSNSAFPLIYNSIFWNNKSANGIDHFAKFMSASDTIYTVFNSLVQGGNIYNLPATHYVNNLDAFPRFVNPSWISGIDNNILDKDWSLLPCSPCINKGNFTFFPDTINNDMASNIRVYNDTIDIGPYEFQGISSGLQQKNIIYVNANSNGEGTSWNDAIGDIQKAIDMPYGCFATSEIWVSAGTYLPDTVGILNANKASFNIRNNLKLYGGFAGNETNIGQRDWVINKSILSGNVGSDTDSTDNCNNIVTVMYQDSLVVLDGFTIRNGYSDNYYYGGAAIYGKNSNLKLKNLTILSNVSEYNGGGIYLTGSVMDLENSSFISNRAYAGAALKLQNTEMKITGCRIINNYGEGGTAGISLQNTRGNIVNCLFSNNYSQNAGAITSSESKYALINSTLTNNKCTFSGPGSISTSDTLYILNSILWDKEYWNTTNMINYTNANLLKIENSNIKNGTNLNLPASNYVNNISIEPVFKYPSNYVGNTNNAILFDWSLKSCSPCINTGFYDSIYISSVNDISGNPRVYNNGFIDMGAFEYQGNEECFFIKFIVTDSTGPGIGYSVSLDQITYKTIDSTGQCQFDNNSLGDKYKYSIRYNYYTVFTDSIRDLQNDTIIYYYYYSINENTSDNDWFIFPNPAKEKIEVISPSGNIKIDILNIEGQVLETMILNDEPKIINISGLARGIYILRIRNGCKTGMRKIVKL